MCVVFSYKLILCGKICLKKEKKKKETGGSSNFCCSVSLEQSLAQGRPCRNFDGHVHGEPWMC